MKSKSFSLSESDYVYVAGDNGDKHWLGRISDIVALEADTGSYLTIRFSNGQKLRVRGPLDRWEAELPSSIFFRTGRDWIVNLSHVKLMQAYDSRRFLFILEGDIEVLVSRPQSLVLKRTKRLS